MTLTSKQVRGFDEQGYVVVRGLVGTGPLTAAVTIAHALLAADPSPPDKVGPHFLFPLLADAPALAALVPLLGPVAESLLGEGRLVPPASVQLAATVPPFPRGAGRPHVDGSTGTPGGRPDTFSLLAGVVLSDQTAPEGGGVWVWPGSHREHAAHFAAHGPEAFWAGDPGYPDVTAARPVQLLAAPGDLVLAHHLLGHCPAGTTAAWPRVTAYFRLTARGHDWRAALVDARADLAGLHA